MQTILLRGVTDSEQLFDCIHELNRIVKVIEINRSEIDLFISNNE
jgi:hypothetical protein